MNRARQEHGDGAPFNRARVEEFKAEIRRQRPDLPEENAEKWALACEEYERRTPFGGEGYDVLDENGICPADPTRTRHIWPS